jgi:hypothetical protein
MALNRYLYPVNGTNIVGCVILATRVSIDGATGDVTSIEAGRGLTIVRSGAGVNTVYTVSIDNGGSVHSIVDVHAVTAVPYNKSNHVEMHVKSISATGCELQAVDPQNKSLGHIDVSCSLCVQLVCALSAVTA